MSEIRWLCISEAGLVVPVPTGGMKTLNRGDVVEGEYYRQVAAKVRGLILEDEVPKDMRERIEKERRMRTGEGFPEEFTKSKEEHAKDYDPRLDGPCRSANSDLAEAVREGLGKTKAERGFSSAGKSDKNKNKMPRA